MKNYFALLALLVFAGCASQHAQISVARFDATVRPATKRVEYFEDESQVRRPFMVIAIVSVPGEGADVQSGGVAQVLGQALDQARKLGGEALILHRTGPANSGGSAG